VRVDPNYYRSRTFLKVAGKVGSFEKIERGRKRGKSVCVSRNVICFRDLITN
jgi:hypothetical protein